MPQPPGSFSRRRQGKGFMMSKRRKRRKPARRNFQLRMLMPLYSANAAASSGLRKRIGATGARARISVRCTPETSSITTYCGSFTPTSSDICRLVRTPSKARISHTAIEGTRRSSVPPKPVIKGAVFPIATSIPFPRSRNHVNGCDTTAINKPTNDPQVPGPGFRKPVPKTVAIAYAKVALGAGTACSVDVVIVIVSAFPQFAAIVLGEFLFVEDGVGHDVLFRGP